MNTIIVVYSPREEGFSHLLLQTISAAQACAVPSMRGMSASENPISKREEASACQRPQPCEWRGSDEPRC